VNVFNFIKIYVFYEKSKCRYHYVPLTRIYKCCKKIRKLWGKHLRGCGQKQIRDNELRRSIVFKKLIISESRLEGKLNQYGTFS